MLFSNLEDLNNDIKHELSSAFTNTNTDLSFGFILRSNAKDATFSQIIEEATKLKDIYKDLLRKAIYGLFYTKVYESAPSYISDINHLMYENDFEVITDSEKIYNLIAKETNIDNNKLRLYKDDLLPLYSLYSIKSNITNALKKNVWLKSGAYLVIEETEALTVIDVNSGKFISKKGKDKDLSNYRVNIEAAKEALLQLRLRNISGIIIIDFINMKSEELNLNLLKELRGLAKCDELPTKIVDMTKLGLVEITRTKKGQTLKERMGLNKNE
jgi:ribonuclease G